MYWLAHSK